MSRRYPEYQRIEATHIEEKAKKLFGITRLLDQHVIGDFESLLPPGNLTKSSQIRALNQALCGFTDEVALCFPGVGVGYYSKDLRAILTYGPSGEFGSKVGMDLGKDHIGWGAMETGKEALGVGSMIRGDIMNCVRPLVRGDRTIGFVWANETLADIYAQLQSRVKNLFFLPGAEPLMGFTGMLLFASKLLVTGEQDEEARHRVIRDIMQLNQYIRVFLNSLNAGIVLGDSSGRIVFASSGVAQVLGASSSELVGMELDEILGRLGLQSEQVLGAASDGNVSGPSQMTARSPYKDKLVDIVSTSITGGDGSTWGHVVVIEDLEESLAYEERLSRAERLAAVGEIAASVAHEIRNPLTVVKSAAALMPDRLEDRSFLKRFSEIAVTELDRMNRTVDALMDFSRYSKPSMTLVDVDSLVQRACDVVRPYAKLNNVSVQTACAGEPPSTWGDPDHLMQALLNLLLNGIQAMPEGGDLSVEVVAEAGSRFIKILVSDTGCGIANEYRSRIFDMFFTLKKGGTGLGLPLVQRIVFEHHGFVDYESEVGKGTVFRVQLPLSSRGSDGSARASGGEDT